VATLWATFAAQRTRVSAFPDVPERMLYQEERKKGIHASEVGMNSPG